MTTKTTKKRKKDSEDRFAAARDRLAKVMKRLAKFPKRRQYVRVTTTGNWQEGSAEGRCVNAARTNGDDCQ